MRFKKIFFMLLLASILSSSGLVSFAASKDVEVTWQDDLDESGKGNLRIQQYSVDDLYFASQGNGSPTQNRITNERIWEDETIIFDDERIKSASYYIDAKTKKKTLAFDSDILFYKDSDYFGDGSKQASKAWGYYVPSKSGYYKFKMVSDDGSYLSIYRDSDSLNDLIGKEKVLINDMNVSSYNANVSESLYLEAKKPYPILIKYFNWGGDGQFTFESSYSKKGDWKSNANYSPVNKKDLYPSKKIDFFIIHGDSQYLKNINITAVERLSTLEGQSSIEIDKLRSLIDKSKLMILEYYNYGQDEMDKLYDEIRISILQLDDPVVELQKPYPDDFLIDEIGKLMVQTYKASDINSAYEGGNSNSVYNNNRSNWTNESFIFDPDRKDGPAKLFTAEIIKERLNSAKEEVFFYDGGGNYGYDAKEIREAWGYFVANKTGYYQFESLYDDGIRAYLYVDKDLNDLKYTRSEARQLASHYAIGVFGRASNVVRLEAGRAYPIYINHFNWHGPNKLALRYRYSNTSSSISADYKDIPSSWFYASDKEDFFEIHGDISPLIGKKLVLEEALASLGPNASREDRDKFNSIIVKANIMIDKYYNYTQDEINNFLLEADKLLKDNNHNIKIRRYTQNNREYIEIIEPFNDGEIDSQILKLEKSDENAYPEPSVTNGELRFKGQTRFALSEKLNDYDYIEISIDQADANPGHWYPYAGIGVSANNYYYDYIEMQYLKKFNNGNNRNMQLDFGSVEKFSSNGYTDFTTKLIAEKNSDGKFDVVLKLYPMGQTSEDKLLTSIYSSKTDYNFKDIYLGSYDYYWYDYKLDNLKILAYKELAPFDVEIENFRAKTSGSFIELTWDKADEVFDSYVIKELIDGVIIKEYDSINSSASNFFINLSTTSDYSDRTFEIYAKKNLSYSSKKTATWQGGVSFLSITNFLASTNLNNIVLTWDSLDSKLIDKYLIKEITPGHESILDSNVDKDTKTYTLPIIENLRERTFTIEAYRGSEKTKYAQAGWENYLSTMTINQFSAHTGKKLGKLVFEDVIGKTRIEDVSLSAYKMQGFNAETVTFELASKAKSLSVMYIKKSNSNMDESMWKSEALESINRYISESKIDFYEDSYYATRYNTGTSSDLENTNADLIRDFKRILETAGLTNLRDKNLQAYKDAILNQVSYKDLDGLQLIIDEVNGPIDMINKDKNGDDYVDLVDDTKVTTHDFEFGLATEINITNSSIYNVSFEFELQGNEYLTYKNPTVYLYDSNKSRISSKATIEYDAENFKYMIEIIPTGSKGRTLETGTYYVNLDTKTEVNTEEHSIEEIIKNNSDVISKAKIKKPWEFSYYINEIVIDGNKITDDLFSIMKINYTTSDKSSDLKTITSDKVNFKLENTKTLPGGF